MQTSNGKDYYEILQLNANATQDAIERMFRYLAVKYHPDKGGDKERFNFLVKAFEILRDPVSRASYDAEQEQEKKGNAALTDHARKAGPDTIERHELLCLFYARRRQAENSPALGAHTVKKMMNLPDEVLEFHLWYFREKGWIKRAENGGLVITAEGVDKVEEGEIKLNQHLRLESKSNESSPITLGYDSNETALANSMAL